MKYKLTSRGFRMFTFIDLYNKNCSVQESSLAEIAAIWFGVDTYRMHLDQEMARGVLPILQHFVDTGELPDEESIKL